MTPQDEASARRVARKNVETRASGRPPEEAQSDNPEEQAEIILEDSEERTAQMAEHSAQSDS